MVIHFASCYIRGNITVNNHRRMSSRTTRHPIPVTHP